MAKKKNVDQPDEAASQETKILWALNGLVDTEGPVMVTAWVAIIEYMDNTGETQLAPLASSMSQWHMTGMIDAGRDMLIAEYDYAEEWEDDE